jgi:hypothetical protein
MNHETVVRSRVTVILALCSVLSCGRTSLDDRAALTAGALSPGAQGGRRSSGGSDGTKETAEAGAGGSGGTTSSWTTAPTVLAEGLGCPSRIVVDAASVYWTDSARGNVMKVGLAGGAAITLADGQQEPLGIAVDAGHVYWVDSAAGTIMRVPLSGGLVDTLAAGQLQPRDLVVSSGSVYWVNNGKSSLEVVRDGSVMKVDLPNGKPVSLATSEVWPTAIAIDGTSLYWTNAGTQDGDYRSGDVRKMSLTGNGSPVTIATIGSMSNSRLAVHDARVYWVTSGYVLETGVSGNDRINVVATVVAWNPGGNRWTTAVAVAVDTAAVYWSESGAAIRKVAWPNGGFPVTIALQGDGSNGDIALDGTSVYWSSCGAGTIMRAAK